MPHLTNHTWPTYAQLVASPAAPEEFCEAAVERLTKDLEEYIVRVTRVRPQFKALNTVSMIEFQTDEERKYYESAYERYLEERAKLLAKQESEGGSVGFMILVEFLKFRQAAELCRAPLLAKSMFESVTKHNQAAVCALNFKATLIKIVKILHDTYGVSRDDISLIWGGGQNKGTKKQQAKGKLMQNADLLKQLADANISMEDLDLDAVEEKVLEDLPEELRLGTQTKPERQREIDKFQAGKSLYCLYTFRAGGVGLSLHHTDELTKEKARRKKNGYAYQEDIPKIPVRQRINFVAPTFSAIELVQGLGRCPRLTSLSDTPQVLLFYKDTIEEHVAKIVSAKLRCLTKVVQHKEDWSDVIIGGAETASQQTARHLAMTSEGDKDEDGSLMVANGGEEEE